MILSEWLVLAHRGEVVDVMVPACQSCPHEVVVLGTMMMMEEDMLCSLDRVWECMMYSMVLSIEYRVEKERVVV